MATQEETKSKAQDRANAVLEGVVEPQKVMEVYDGWAPTYETGMASLDYKAPALLAEKMTRLFGDNKSVKILDIAAGSGLVGVQLQKHGFTNIDAVDANEAMLKEAEKKNVYQRLICDFVGTNKMDIADDTYDAIVVSGAFTPNHLKEDCLEELIRITKPGGLVVPLVAGLYIPEAGQPRSKLELKIQKLVDAGRWSLVEKEVVENYLLNTSGVFFVLRVPQ